MEFVKYLKEQRPGKRFAIFWDGASYYMFDSYMRH